MTESNRIIHRHTCTHTHAHPPTHTPHTWESGGGPLLPCASDPERQRPRPVPQLDRQRAGRFRKCRELQGGEDKRFREEGGGQPHRLRPSPSLQEPGRHRRSSQHFSEGLAIILNRSLLVNICLLPLSLPSPSPLGAGTPVVRPLWRKGERSDTAGGKSCWCSPSGKHNGGSSKG